MTPREEGSPEVVIFQARDIIKDKFTSETIEEIRTSKYKEKMFVFLDKALTDSDKINLSAFVRLKVI
ncbi:MAG TPA: hypothetical protein DEG96_05575 [Candidatus Atribacteria bacterium]|nr:hypothetical protein [Candidatus Atribacteria bacterium]